MTRTDKAIKKLREASRRLDDPQGRVARRNARKAMLAALRGIRQAMDAEFPVIRKAMTSRRKPDPKRAAKGRARISQQAHRQLMAAGISPSAFVERGKAGQNSHTILAPEWMVTVMQARFGPKTIAKATRSIKYRRRLLAAIKLGTRGKTKI